MMAQMDEEEMPDVSEYIMSRNGVDLIPPSMVLSAVDAKLRLEMRAEKMLYNILDLLRDYYDYILIYYPVTWSSYHKRAGHCR